MAYLKKKKMFEMLKEITGEELDNLKNSTYEFYRGAEWLECTNRDPIDYRKYRIYHQGSFVSLNSYTELDEGDSYSWQELNRTTYLLEDGELIKTYDRRETAFELAKDRSELEVHYSSPYQNRPDANFRDAALEAMNKYGYEEVYVKGPSEDGFIAIKSNRPNAEAQIFDGWEMVRDYFREVDELSKAYSADQLHNRLNGDYSEIEYNGQTDKQFELAIEKAINEALENPEPVAGVGIEI